VLDTTERARRFYERAGWTWDGRRARTASIAELLIARYAADPEPAAPPAHRDPRDASRDRSRLTCTGRTRRGELDPVADRFIPDPPDSAEIRHVRFGADATWKRRPSVPWPVVGRLKRSLRPSHAVGRP
jgi:hypothetical protein